MYINFEPRKKGPTMGKILLHTALVFLTGGLWLIVLLVRFLVKN